MVVADLVVVAAPVAVPLDPVRSGRGERPWWCAGAAPLDPDTGRTWLYVDGAADGPAALAVTAATRLRAR